MLGCFETPQDTKDHLEEYHDTWGLVEDIYNLEIYKGFTDMSGSLETCMDYMEHVKSPLKRIRPSGNQWKPLEACGVSRKTWGLWEWMGEGVWTTFPMVRCPWSLAQLALMTWP